MKAQTKPVVVDVWAAQTLIEHWQLNISGFPLPIAEALDEGRLVINPDSIDILTLEGVMRANRDDWVICGVEGELYPCKPEIFDKTYEIVNE